MAKARAAKAAKGDRTGKAGRKGRADRSAPAAAAPQPPDQPPAPGSVLDRYWAALAAKDADAMAACYAPTARFQDEVFRLDGADAGAMWRMLFRGSTDLRIEAGPLTSHGERAFGTWQAWYTFRATGRPVHNVIRSEFKAQGGTIVEQRDRFPFWRWSRQALGWRGWLLGWTPLVRNRVRKQGRAMLANWKAQKRAP